jgi:hypothetical protein
MSSKSSSRDLVWIVIGSLGLLIAFGTVLYLRGNDPVAQIASKEKRLALVNEMRLSLAAASEALNSAVMSTREKDSSTFVEEVRSADADLEHGRIQLEQLLKERAEPHEAELMERVDQSLREFRQIQKQLLDLALQNSNRKAFELAFGPAMKLLNEMNEALFRIVAEYTDSTSDNKLRVVHLAEEARIGILSTQVLLLPHIAEASDLKMDEFEVQLSEHARKVRENLAALKVVLLENDQSNIETTTSRYTEFEQLKSQIITLSRQNTDLRAVTIALKDKRQVMLACQDALVSLEHAIRAEPITSAIPSGRSP